MPDGSPISVSTGLLSLASLWLFAGFVVTTGLRGWRRGVVGEELAHAREGFPLPELLCAAVGVGVAAGILVPSGPQTLFLLFCGALAAGIALQSPRSHEARVGAGGFSYAWEAWRWEEVRAWRLLGEHLRVDVGERWLAVRVEDSARERVAHFLESELADRKSAFEA